MGTRGPGRRAVPVPRRVAVRPLHGSRIATDGRREHPSAWNALGLLPVAAGIALIVWVIALHRREAVRHGWRFEKTPFEPQRYLIVGGPYRYSRNPIYLSHLAIWIGWALFYGSVAVLLGVVAIWLLLRFLILPYEERGLRRASDTAAQLLVAVDLCQGLVGQVVTVSATPAPSPSR